MSLNRERERLRLRQQQIENFRKGLLQDLALQGPYYPIKPGYRFNPNFLPIQSTRYIITQLGGQDKVDGLPLHQY